ncbi:MAG: hypothetical protein K2M44_07530 [Clostridia bacterium]|nr:hypothetical protein [Clostridia bacterium]
MVRKILTVCVVAAALAITYITPLTLAGGEPEIEVYLAGRQDGGVYTGVMTIIDTDKSGAEKLYSHSDFMGISLRYPVDNSDVDALCAKLATKVVSKQVTSDGIECVYLYSPLLTESVRIDGAAVNMQIAITDNYLIVGFPLIMGSY